MRERLRKFLSQQLGKPSGLFGRLIANRMARGNLYDAQWTISLLNIQPEQRVLEIGFGPGVSAQMASAKASKGFVSGIDHSQTMVQVASRRNALAIQAGRMELRQGEVSLLPYPADLFDVAFSVHSIYFWHHPGACLQEIRRVLRPGGLLAVTIQPKDAWKQQMDPSSMTLYSGTEIAVLFSGAGLREVRVEVPPVEDGVSLECVLGVK